MAQKKPGAKLSVVRSNPAATHGEPPPHLDGAGLVLWREVTSAYEFSDPGSYQTLAQCCFAATRAERCRALIDSEGEIIRGRNGPREHPLLRSEIASRAFTVRVLQKLGLDLEPVRSGPGRPPSVA